MTAVPESAHSRRSEIARPLYSGSCALGLVAGTLVLATLGAVGQAQPLPALWWAAAFLFCVAWLDTWQHRIPNALTLPSLLAALAGAGIDGGTSAVFHSLAGALLSLAVLFLPFALRGMGAGDLKACAVLGALWGPLAGLSAITWAVLWAGCAAIAWLLLRGELLDLVRRWTHSVGLSFALRQPTYLRPSPGSCAAQGLPFGVALGFGAATHAALGTLWGA